MIDPSSNELPNREFVDRAAQLASSCAAIHRQFEMALSEALRVAFTDTRLIYLRSEHTGLLRESANKALEAAFQGESPANIALVIEEYISLAIDERLRELAGNRTVA